MFSRKNLSSLFVILATFAGVLSLLLSGMLVKELSREERQKMEIWAKAAESMSRDENDVDMSLVLSILQGNSSIPAILHDEKSGRMESHNIRLPKEDTATCFVRRWFNLVADMNL